jgi:DNA repair exonuclease SbcCD ATPase subunit
MDGIAKMAAKGTTPTLTKTGEDVTDQYVDVKARLESLEVARDRLKEIMSEAQNTNDLLLAEQQLTQREAEIEALKGRMQYLEQSAALSSINITLQPYVLSQPVDSSWRPAETVREAFDALLNNLQNLGDFLIRFVIGVVPILLIVGLIIYGIFLFVRGQVRRSRARNAPAGSEEG